MDISIVGRNGFTSRRGAERMIARGIARRISESQIEMIDDDHRVKATPNPDINPPTWKGVSASMWRANLGPVTARIEDAFPGHPVLWTIGYDRRTPGSYQKAA